MKIYCVLCHNQLAIIERRENLLNVYCSRCKKETVIDIVDLTERKIRMKTLIVENIIHDCKKTHY